MDCPPSWNHSRYVLVIPSGVINLSSSAFGYVNRFPPSRSADERSPCRLIMLTPAQAIVGGFNYVMYAMQTQTPCVPLAYINCTNRPRRSASGILRSAMREMKNKKKNPKNPRHINTTRIVNVQCFHRPFILLTLDFWRNDDVS